MKVSTTGQPSLAKRSALPKAKEAQHSPLVDVYRVSDKIWDFSTGVLPAVGTLAHMNSVVFESNPDTTMSAAGMLLNSAGTLSGAVALGQLAVGATPGLALGITAATLGASGLLYAMNR